MREILSTIMLLGACTAALAAAPGAQTPEQEAKALASQFVGQLKPQLKQAMGEGGPTLAIEVCTRRAPAIADAISAESGWTVRRVSLKSRNPGRAVPDKWEEAVLREFDRRQRAGEQAADISFGELSDGRYRFMQAQGVEPLCLLCHGKGLSDEVQATLEQYYPDDLATGYSLGQVRGGISVSSAMQDIQLQPGEGL